MRAEALARIEKAKAQQAGSSIGEEDGKVDEQRETQIALLTGMHDPVSFVVQKVVKAKGQRGNGNKGKKRKAGEREEDELVTETKVVYPLQSYLNCGGVR